MRDSFQKLLELAVNDTYFKCNSNINKQKETYSMGTQPFLIESKYFLN